MKFTRIQFTPDLMPSDITGTEIIDQDPATRQAEFPLRARAGFLEHRAGRRNQPHAAQDAGRPAAGDAGIRSHGGRQHLQARPAVLRDGHAEPDRAGRHLSAAGGPVGPLHALDQHRLPDADRRAGDRHGHHADEHARRSGRCCRARTSCGSSNSCARCPRASTWSITRSTWRGPRGPRNRPAPIS